MSIKNHDNKFSLKSHDTNMQKQKTIIKPFKLPLKHCLSGIDKNKTIKN